LMALASFAAGVVVTLVGVMILGAVYQRRTKPKDWHGMIDDTAVSVEAVARAMCEADGILPDEQHWRDPDELLWEGYVDAAQAALDAIGIIPALRKP